MATKTTQKAKAIENVFGSAVATKGKAKSKKSKGDKPELEMKEGFDTYVALILTEKALDGVKKQLEGQYKEDAYEHFCTLIHETEGKKPESTVGVEGDATALFQFKKRGAGFNQEVADKLDENNIPYDKTEVVPERFIINPELLGDQKKLGELAQAIEKMGLDFDVIQKQQPTYKYNIDDETLKKISKIKDQDIRDELVKAVSSVAVSQAKIGGVDAKGGALDAAIKILKENGIL